jgi:hypothetical protein
VCEKHIPPGLREFSIDRWILFDPKQQKQGKEGNKRQEKKKRIGVAAEKGDSSLFSLPFFDAVATLLSLPLIIQE